MNALSLALTQQKSAAIFVFLLLANSKYTPSYDMKEMFFLFSLHLPLLVSVGLIIFIALHLQLILPTQ